MLESRQLRDLVPNPPHQRNVNLALGEAGHVVGKEGQVGRLRHHAVVLGHGLVRLRVEEGRDTTNGLASRLGRVFGQAGGPMGGGGSHMHDVVRAPGGLISRDLRNAHVFRVVQQHALARATGHPEALHAGLDVELHDLAEGVLVSFLPGQGVMRPARPGTWNP